MDLDCAFTHRSLLPGTMQVKTGWDGNIQLVKLMHQINEQAAVPSQQAVPPSLAHSQLPILPLFRRNSLFLSLT